MLRLQRQLLLGLCCRANASCLLRLQRQLLLLRCIVRSAEREGRRRWSGSGRRGPGRVGRRCLREVERRVCIRARRVREKLPEAASPAIAHREEAC